MPSVTLKIISLGFLLVCTRTSSSSPHFALISWSRASISSLLFVSTITSLLQDLKVLKPTFISPGIMLAFNICLIESGACSPLHLTVILNTVAFVPRTAVTSLLLVVSVGSAKCRSTTSLSYGLVTVDGVQCCVTASSSSVVAPAGDGV